VATVSEQHEYSRIVYHLFDIPCAVVPKRIPFLHTYALQETG
jgi:hypothetical protein